MLKEAAVQKHELNGKVAIITGAGRGIGRAMALAFARAGANLALASRTAAELEGAAEEVVAEGGVVAFRQTDVSRREDFEALVEFTLSQYGRVDVLVNNAGTYGPIGPFAETDLERWAEALQVNLGGTLNGCRAVLPLMIRQKGGKIINMSGGGATGPLPNFTAYGVSKTAVVRLTETLAEEVRGHNVQVNAIAPGAVDTRLQDDLLAAGERAGRELHERMSRMRETGEGGVPPELAAELAVFLASAAGDKITGKLIAAPHDGWQEWDAARIEELASKPWFTLRRMDPFTVRPLCDDLREGS